VLIVKLGSIGDVVHALPCLEVMRSLDEPPEVFWAVGELCYPLLKDDPRLKGVILIKKESIKVALRKCSFFPLLRELRGSIRELRSRDFDVVFDLHGDLKSALVSLLSRSSFRFTFCDASEGNPLLLKRVPCREESVHVVERYLDVVRKFFNLSLKKAPYASVFVSEKARSVVSLKFGELFKKRIVSLIPSSSWESKSWLYDRWERLSAKLNELGFKPVVIGGSDASSLELPGALNLAGRMTLEETCAFLKRSFLAIGLDTGPTHISASLGVPTIALFGPIPPWRNSPWGPRVKVLYHSVGCNPCRKRSCRERKCMRSIEVEEVLEAIHELTALAL